MNLAVEAQGAQAQGRGAAGGDAGGLTAGGESERARDPEQKETSHFDLPASAQVKE